MVRKAKNKYTWHGISRMPAALQRLWKEGAEEFGEDLILDGRDDEEEKESVKNAKTAAEKPEVKKEEAEAEDLAGADAEAKPKPPVNTETEESGGSAEPKSSGGSKQDDEVSKETAEVSKDPKDEEKEKEKDGKEGGDCRR